MGCKHLQLICVILLVSCNEIHPYLLFKPLTHTVISRLMCYLFSWLGRYYFFSASLHFFSSRGPSTNNSSFINMRFKNWWCFIKILMKSCRSINVFFVYRKWLCKDYLGYHCCIYWSLFVYIYSSRSHIYSSLFCYVDSSSIHNKYLIIL